MEYSVSLKLNHIFRRLYKTNGVANGYLVLYAKPNRTACGKHDKTKPAGKFLAQRVLPHVIPQRTFKRPKR